MFLLSDEQLDRVMAAAALLPIGRRDIFLRSVAGRVAGLPSIGLAEIESAINFVLNSYGVVAGSNAIAGNSQYVKGVFKNEEQSQIFR
jgi:hypothetical protein